MSTARNLTQPALDQPAPGKAAPDPRATVPIQSIWRCSVQDYHAMIRTGILEEGAPIELLEGLLVLKRTKNQPHTFSTQSTRDLLARVLQPGGTSVTRSL